MAKEQESEQLLSRVSIKLCVSQALKGPQSWTVGSEVERGEQRKGLVGTGLTPWQELGKL